MAQFESIKDQIAAAGANLLYVAAQKSGGFFKPAKHLMRHPGCFPFLVDEDRKVVKAYGLYHRFGIDAFNIARPATLVVDRGGVLRFVYRSENQLDRAPIEQVLEVLQTLQAGGSLPV
jgi:peroxiredoxin